jgi:hypothetical protein
MPNASTDVGKELTKRCDAIARFVSNYETSGLVGDDRLFASSITDFYEYFRQLPAILCQKDHGFTALFEIDRTLEGFYSEESLRLNQDNPKAMRGLIVDYAALLQKFYVIPRLTAADARYGKLPGVDRFYQRWKEEISRNTPGRRGVSEYDRACFDAATLLSAQDFSLPVRLSLMAKLGEIVLTLGVDLDYIKSRIQSYADHITVRDVQGNDVVNGELLLNLQALFTLTQDIRQCGISVPDLEKAIRYWSSRNSFLDLLFKEWRWNWLNDYTTAVAPDERGMLTDVSELFRTHEGPAQLGVGRSFLEYETHRVQKPTEFFQPIPIFVLGRSFVGKSSFFTSVYYQMAHRGGISGRSLTFGQQLQDYYSKSQDSWMAGKSVPTAAYVYFDFWRDVDVTGFFTYDYRGGDSEPQQWDPKLQEMFRNSRGILFMVDENDLDNAEAMRARATWSRTIIDYWRNSNPQARHLPIAFVINKIDLIIPEALPLLQRTTLLPNNFQPAFVENYAISRSSVETPDLRSPYGRFVDCLLHEPANNVHPKLQDLLLSITENFGQFFSRVLDVTYNYQIFLTSSRAPREGDPLACPVGVMEPLLWMTEVLHRNHTLESMSIYESELRSIGNEIGAMNRCVTKLRELVTVIDGHERAKEKEVSDPSTWFPKQREERIKHLEGLIATAEASFDRTASEFLEKPPKIKEEALNALQALVKSKSDLAEGLRRRMKKYELERERFKKDVW